ncbi:MAG: hypothetical protein ACREMD_03080 [Gemmatimonadota bacterium]
MIDGRFLGLLAALAVAGGVAGWSLVDHLEGGPQGLVAGLVFSVLSFAVGHHCIRWSAQRSPGRFVGTVLGVFAGRVVALLGFALVVAFGIEAHVAVALLTVVAAHFSLGAAELVYLKRTDALG